MYSGLPLHFKNLLSHKNVKKVLVTALSQNFRSTVNDTISDLEGNNRQNCFRADVDIRQKYRTQQITIKE